MKGGANLDRLENGTKVVLEVALDGGERLEAQLQQSVLFREMQSEVRCRIVRVFTAVEREGGREGALVFLHRLVHDAENGGD